MARQASRPGWLLAGPVATAHFQATAPIKRPEWLPAGTEHRLPPEGKEAITSLAIAVQ